MAKLYAEITSDKGGRVVGKGGNQNVKVAIYDKNTHVATVEISKVSENQSTILVYPWDESVSAHISKGM